MNFLFDHRYLKHTQLLRYSGLLTYILVSIPLLHNFFVPQISLSLSKHLVWMVCYLAFGLAYWLCTRDMGKRSAWPVKLPLLVIMNLAAFGISYSTASGISAILLMVIAGVVPWLLPFWPGLLWAILQYFSLMPAFMQQPGWGWLEAFLQSSLYLGFAGFTFVTSSVAQQQAQAREEQRRLNSELRATRSLLADSSRMAERLRIARELHDLVGHHLTALSLNLEVAQHLVADAAKEHVLQAQSVAKLLLSDVREVVSQLREDDVIDLTQALKTLMEGVPGLNIHLELPPHFSVDDPQRAQVVLRCVQEIITNTVRHSGANHLDLKFERNEQNELTIHARDDGRGANAQFVYGNGLIGMRERLQQVGGKFTLYTSPGKGFQLEVWLPLSFGTSVKIRS